MIALGFPGAGPFVELTRDAGADTYRRWENDTRTSLLEMRPCTVDESAQLTRIENDVSLRAQVKDSVIVLRTSIDSLQGIVDKTNANIGPADTKSVARECRRVARQVLALTRLFVDALDSADTGQG